MVAGEIGCPGRRTHNADQSWRERIEPQMDDLGRFSTDLQRSSHPLPKMFILEEEYIKPMDFTLQIPRNHQRDQDVETKMHHYVQDIGYPLLLA